MIWERDGDHIVEVEHDKGDYPRWIDTSVMLADPLTQAMKADVLVKTFKAGIFDMTPTQESLAIKERSRQLRQQKKEQTKSEEQ